MTAKKKAPATAATKGDINALRAELAKLEAAAAEPVKVKLIKSGYARVGSTKEADAVEALVAPDRKGGALTVKAACEELELEYVEHEIPEGSTGPIVVIDTALAEE